MTPARPNLLPFWRPTVGGPSVVRRVPKLRAHRSLQLHGPSVVVHPSFVHLIFSANPSYILGTSVVQPLYDGCTENVRRMYRKYSPDVRRMYDGWATELGPAVGSQFGYEPYHGWTPTVGRQKGSRLGRAGVDPYFNVLY